MTKPKVEIVPDDDPRWSLAAQGDIEARNSLVEEHYPLLMQVVHTMMRKLPTNIESLDLAGYGSIGLIKAVETYDPEKASFRTHAAFRITNAIYDGLRQEDWAPKTFRKKVKDLDAVREQLCEDLEREPTDEELGEAFDKDAEWVRTLRREEEATRHHTIHDLEDQYGSIDFVPEFSSPKQAVESSAAVAQCQDLFVDWLKSLPVVLKIVWYSTYFERNSSESVRDILGIRSYEYSLIHKQLIFSFDQLMEEIRHQLS